MIDDVQINVPLQTKLTDDEIMHWYNHLLDWKTTNVSGKIYAERHNLNHKKLGNMGKALLSCSYTNPKKYQKLISLGKEYLNGNEPLKDFCKKHQIEETVITNIATHIKYLARIKEIMNKSEPVEPEPMSFIQVPKTTKMSEPTSPEAEVVEKKNDIELIVDRNVKVILSPQIASEKIIKIIEFLKEL